MYMGIEHASELDIDNRVRCLLANWVAYDPHAGHYLRRSAGRVKMGRPMNYYICSERGEFKAHLIKAYSNTQAVLIARAWIAKLGNEEKTQ